jgi:hypothetical protein
MHTGGSTMFSWLGSVSSVDRWKQGRHGFGLREKYGLIITDSEYLMHTM